MASATPQECFDVVTDPDLATEWVSMASSVTAEGDPGEGRVLHIRARIVGVSINLDATVTTWDEPTEYAYGGEKPFHQHMRFHFTEAADDTTMRCQVEFDPGKFFKLGTGKVAARTFGKQFEGDLDRLVDLIQRRS